jgi:PAS domain S-box-containing protein
MLAQQEARIMVVEDEVLVAKDMHCCLKRLGYQVVPCEATASEAIGLAEHCRPDLVLMDIHLDGPTDGIEAAGVISAEMKIPVVFVTAYSDFETVERAKQTAPYGYVLKPIRIEELRIAVDLALHKHQIEKKLRERERWFSTTLRSIADAVVTVGLDSTVTFMNPAAESLSGVSALEGLGKPVIEVLKISDMSPVASRTPLERALAEKRVVEMTQGILTNRCTGEQRLIADSAAPVIADGETLGAVMVFSDVTEQRQLQEQILISERLVSVGMLAAGVAHEINNPLMVLSANLELLSAGHGQKDALETPTDSETRAQVLADMAEASRRIRDVVRDLSLLAAPGTRESHSIDVRRVLDSSLRMAKNEMRHRARVVCELAGAPFVWGVESRLGQVFLNLLVNAAHAIPIGNAEENRIRVSLRTGGEGEVVIMVEDTGVGMSKAIRDRLFTPFFTTKPVGSGTGLGLTICRGIVTSMGGSIQIDSEPGRGTLVRVTLPPMPAGRLDKPPHHELPCTSPRLRVLVVDDEPAIARVFESMLTLDHDVTTSTSGRNALTMIQHGAQFDTILCDLMMPQMSGMELHKRLLQSHPDQAERMIFITGGCFTAQAAEFIALPTTKRLSKPISMDSLRSAVNRSSHVVH